MYTPAYVNASLASGLQARAMLISSSSAPQVKAAGMSTGNAPDFQKLAQAAVAIDRLVDTVKDVSKAHQESAKLAEALTQSIKLAQDGAIDIEDIFEVAQRQLNEGSVKVSASRPLGEVVQPAAPSASTAEGLDPLTSFLRSVAR